VYDLHIAYLGLMGAETNTTIEKFQWIPIDVGMMTFYQKKNNRVPGTFEPKGIRY